MPEQTRERGHDRLVFTDEDFNRRYSGEEAAAGAADPADRQAKPAGRRIHGGGNAFMRARRRRAASPQMILTDK